MSRLAAWGKAQRPGWTGLDTVTTRNTPLLVNLEVFRNGYSCYGANSCTNTATGTQIYLYLEHGSSPGGGIKKF